LRGQTPVLRHNFGTREKVSIISAVGTNGKLHFQFKLKESFKGPDVVRFLRHLLRYTRGKVLVFLDGAQQHKSEAVKEFIAQHSKRLTVKFLPPYSFEYNPDEPVWEVKWTKFRNFTPYNTLELLAAYEKEFRRMRRRKGFVGGCFRQSKLPLKGLEKLLT